MTQKLAEGADTPEGCASIQSTSKMGCQEPQAAHQETWEDTPPRSSQWCWGPCSCRAALQKRMWGPGGHEVEHNMPFTAKRANATLSCIRKSATMQWGRWSSLLSICEAAPGAPHPVLGSPVYERQSYCRKFSKGPWRLRDWSISHKTARII